MRQQQAKIRSVLLGSKGIALKVGELCVLEAWASLTVLLLTNSSRFYIGMASTHTQGWSPPTPISNAWPQHSGMQRLNIRYDMPTSNQVYGIQVTTMQA